jgi:hypothetical protein
MELGGPMTYRQSIEAQLRTAMERLIIVPPAEQPSYLTQIAQLASRLAKEKQCRTHHENPASSRTARTW